MTPLRFDPPQSHTSLSKNADGVFDAEQRAITNIAEPTEQQDAATKQYVDNATGKYAGVWRGSNNTSIEEPGSGQLRLDALQASSATNLAISAFTDNGVDYKHVFANTLPGDTVKIQDQSNSDSWVHFEIAATVMPFQVQADWWAVPVTLLDAGPDLLVLKNQKLIVVIAHLAAATRAALVTMRTAPTP